MLIDRDREPLLGLILPDYIFIEKGLDFIGLGKRWPRSYRLGLLVVGDDLIADVDALIADGDGWPGNELLDFILRFPAERASQRVVGSSYHWGKLRFEVAQSRRL